MDFPQRTQMKGPPVKDSFLNLQKYIRKSNEKHMVSSVNKMHKGYSNFSEMFVWNITSQEESFHLLQCHPKYKATCFFVIITVANIESKHLNSETETRDNIYFNSYL